VSRKAGTAFLRLTTHYSRLTSGNQQKGRLSPPFS
jgi:hypothetical protein